MSMRNKEYLELLRHPFDEKKFIEFIIDLLNLDISSLNKNMIEINNISNQYQESVNYYKYIANYNDGMNNVGVFIIKLNDNTSTRARNMQRNFVAILLKNYDLDGALVSFFSDKEKSWRFSFVKKELSFTDKGVKEELTSAKRFSYLVGEGESVHTAQEFLLKLLDIDDRKITLDDIEKQFDVEKVTKKFFEEYKEKYLQLKESLDKNEDFQTEAKNCDFDSVEFAKKLMGQIVFLYFLQKKGWLGVQLIPNELSQDEYRELIDSNDSVSQNLIKNYYEFDGIKYIVEKTKLRITEVEEDVINLTNIFKNTKYDTPWGSGDKEFIRHIFVQAKIEHKNFFDDYLEYFFYKGLNEKRENQYFPLFNCKIPFLNGGLFEPLNNYRWSSAHFEIPNSLFSNDEKNGILDFLDLYNFTIDEEEPLEKDIAVDPEMLGKIFENLLDVDDRKSKGAFYTPREIVYYMCREALSNYLSNKVGVDYNEILTFIKYGDILSQHDWDLSIDSNTNFAIGKSVFDNLLKIDEALFNVKIADPAVGSGAFPLGMLNEIVKLRNNIQTYILIQKELGIISLEELYNTEHLETDIYNMKLQTIENCIYAVDIETSAVDITKLRLWLSLVVDFPNEKEPRPLPNLDCKIMQGNSLIDEYQDVPLFSKKIYRNSQRKNAREEHVQQNIFGDVADIHIQQTLQLDENSIDLDSYIETLLKLQRQYFSEKDNKLKKELKYKIDSIQMGLVEESLKNNPSKLLKFKEISKKRQKPWFIWELEFYDVFKNNDGFDIVIGNPPYVNIEKIPEADKKVYSKKYKCVFQKYDLYVLFFELGTNILNSDGTLCYITSNKFMSQGYGLELRKFMLKRKIKRIINFNYDVFDSATVRTSIVMYQNTKPTNDNLINIIDVNTKEEKEKFQKEQYDQILQKTFDNLEGNNFRINLTTKKIELLNKIENGTIPLYDICSVNYGLRPSSEQQNLKKNAFIFDSNPIGDYKKYFEGKDMGYWLLKDYKYLNYRPDIMYNPMFKELFENEKLVGLRTLSDIGKLRFIYDNDGCYCNDSVVVLTLWYLLKDVNNQTINRTISDDRVNNSKQYNYEYLQGILNSKMMKFYFNELYYDGTHFYPNHMKILPIKKVNYEFQDRITKLVSEVRNNNSKDLVKEIDKLVYMIYGLNDEEISIIENAIN